MREGGRFIVMRTEHTFLGEAGGLTGINILRVTVC